VALKGLRQRGPGLIIGALEDCEGKRGGSLRLKTKGL